MDKYGFYIIASYGVAGLTLAGLIIREFLTHRHLKKELARHEKN